MICGTWRKVSPGLDFDVVGLSGSDQFLISSFWRIAFFLLIRKVWFAKVLDYSREIDRSDSVSDVTLLI